jgi:large subunit ribosomal protein L6
MSRIGKKPIPVPAGVTVTVGDGRVAVKGPKGELALAVHPAMRVAHDRAAGALIVSRPSDARDHRALHGLTRSLIANMVEGVTRGYTKRLTIHGVGYGAKLEGKALLLSVGYSHPVRCEPPTGVKVEVVNPTTVAVSGCDKQAVGQFAAEIRRVYPPEPYKQKGIRYEGEVVRKKAGKTFVGGTA